MKKTLTTIVCTVLVLASLTVFTSIAKATTFFKDVSTTHYAYDAIQWAYDFNLINGFPDGTFRPNQAVTEEQFAKLLVHYFDLEPVIDDLLKYTQTERESDAYYNTLAAYEVPLNGYFDNSIRTAAITRGTVAQAFAYLLNSDTTLNNAINFLLDYHITSGQNLQYENYNLQRYFGTTNPLTRAQLVVFFHRLQSKNFFYLSTKAENSYANLAQYDLNKKANLARSILDPSLRKGSNWSSSTDSMNKTWNGQYTYFYKYGAGELDIRGRILSITNHSKTSFDISYYTYDSFSSGTVTGKATITSENKARMTQTDEGLRCVIEFEKISSNSIKTTEFYCESGHDKGTNYNGVLTIE